MRTTRLSPPGFSTLWKSVFHGMENFQSSSPLNSDL